MCLVISWESDAWFKSSTCLGGYICRLLHWCFWLKNLFSANCFLVTSPACMFLCVSSGFYDGFKKQKSWKLDIFIELASCLWLVCKKFYVLCLSVLPTCLNLISYGFLRCVFGLAMISCFLFQIEYESLGIFLSVLGTSVYLSFWC